MGRLDQQTRAQKEATIRAAMDRILRGELPPGGKCDVKTLATASGITRAALYSTYLHLKEEFERRRDQLRDTGVIADPRERQIERLKKQVASLKKRVADQEQKNADLTSFQVQAVSRLTVQHEEITRLRTALASEGVVRSLPRGRGL
jgi:chromosome segregation ATPase